MDMLVASIPTKQVSVLINQFFYDRWPDGFVVRKCTPYKYIHKCSILSNTFNDHPLSFNTESDFYSFNSHDAFYIGTITSTHRDR